MKVLVTGATGTLGRALVQELVARGEEVKILARDSKKASRLFPSLEIVAGDITQDNLGLTEDPKVDAIYHLASLLDLSDKRDKELAKVNVIGTLKVLDLMQTYHIPHIFFCSTAYTQGRNAYERSKSLAESDIMMRSGSRCTIFKPSIIVPNSKTFRVENPQHLYSAVRLLAKVHCHAEPVRYKIEDSLHLPPKRMGFRVKADPDATLNLVPVDWVATKMASIKAGGTYWLTSDKPVKVRDLLDWIGVALFLKLKALPDFKMLPHEALFARLAWPFLVYIQSDIALCSSFDDCPPITAEFIQKTVTNSLD